MSEDTHRFWTQHLLDGRTHVNAETTMVVSNAEFANYTKSRSQFQFVNQNDGTTSSTGDDDKDFVNGYAANEAGVTKDFITFMNGFYDIFPETRKLSLHLTSESYGGKYVPEIAAAVATYNDETTDNARKIPLTTLAIGNQWYVFVRASKTSGNARADVLSTAGPIRHRRSSPTPTTVRNMLLLVSESTPWAYERIFPVLQLGLIDDVQAKQLEEPINAAVDAVHRSDWQAGLQAREDMFGMLSVFTGGINW